MFEGIFNLNFLYTVLTTLLMTVGLWCLFKKCGIDPRWSLVPFYRYYKLSVAARAEDQGRGLLISQVLLTVNDYTYKIIRIIQHRSEDSSGDVLFYVTFALTITFFVSQVVYSIRVYSSLCDVFGRRKRWIILWLGVEPFVSILWGVSGKFQPLPEEEFDETPGEISSLNLKGAEGVLSVDIRSRSVRDFFKKKELLKDIVLTIKPGTMVLLLGGSGAGKTTFVNAVTGYEKADATVTLGKKNVYRDFSSVMYDIGFVPQVDLIRYNDTVRNTIEDGAKLKLPKEITREEREEKINNALEIFGLKSVQGSLVSKLSGGQKKRTSIALEFVSDPSLFILDEPDSGLDGVLARDLMERLHAISRKGKIVIVITHSPDRVIDLFDEVIILAKDENKVGRLVFSGKVDDARSFFGRDTMEDIIKMINRRDEGGEGMSDELIAKFGEVRNERA